MNTFEYTQNFLQDRSVVQTMINKAQIDQQDLVIDIGAGKGALTGDLSCHAKKVIAVEIDKKLAQSLQKSFNNRANVKVLNMNILDMPLPSDPFKVVANIPYNLTTDIFGYLFDIPKSSFQRGLLITEWGAAKRFTEHSINPRIIGWNTWFDIKIIQPVSAQSFSPTPSVQSALLKIERRIEPAVDIQKYYSYMAFVSSLLEYPKMRVRDALKPLFTWNQIERISSDAGFNRNQPVGNLTVPQWVHCFNTMHALIPHLKRVHPSMPSNYKKYYKS